MRKHKIYVIRVEVVVGVRPGKSYEVAKADGFEVMSVSEAVRTAQVVQMLLPMNSKLMCIKQR